MYLNKNDLINKKKIVYNLFMQNKSLNVAKIALV